MEKLIFQKTNNNIVIPCYTTPGYTAKLAYRHKFTLCTEFFSYIKPLIHPLYRHPPRNFNVQTRLLHREKWIEYRHQRSTTQLRSWSRYNMLVDADTRWVCQYFHQEKCQISFKMCQNPPKVYKFQKDIIYVLGMCKSLS